jgi:hypothetical protein
MDICEYGPDAYASTLVERFIEWLKASKQGQPGPVPVIVAGAVTCLDIQLELIKWFIAKGPKSGRPVHSQSTPQIPFTIEEFGPPILLLNGYLLDNNGSKNLPVEHDLNYSVSICLDRDDREWVRFVDEAWDIFLRGNIDFVAAEYLSIYDTLRQLPEELDVLIPQIKTYDETARALQVPDRAKTVEYWKQLIERKWLRLEMNTGPDDGRQLYPARYQSLNPWDDIRTQCCKLKNIRDASAKQGEEARESSRRRRQAGNDQ